MREKFQKMKLEVNSMFEKLFRYFKRRFIRILEKNKYYKNTYEELVNKMNDLSQKNIWFIGSAHYNNIGDLAISEATVEFINKKYKDYNIIEIRLCDYYKYSKSLKKLIKKDDIIILQGGGNMGFLYFDAEYNRRVVIKEFSSNKIIIFPCTIDYGNSFREKYEYKKSIKIYNKHKDLTICAREEISYKKMLLSYSNCNIILVPDIVLFMEHKIYKNSSNNIIICMRNDIEKSSESIILKKKLEQLKDCIYTDNIAEINNISIESRKDIIHDKFKELSSGKVVITDRLHVMIFCTIIEVPCLFVDNSNKKISGVYDKWIKDNYNYIKKINLDNDIDEQINTILNLVPKYKLDYLCKLDEIVK